MKSRNTWVALFLIGSGIVVLGIGDKMASSIFAQIGVANTELLGERFTLSSAVGLVIGLAAGIACWVMPKPRSFLGESVDELSKVAWPNWTETRVNTIVVIIFSFISAGILGVFDGGFSFLTNSMMEYWAN